MAISEGLSCEICLRADEPESMVEVPIPYAAHNPNRVAVICPDCAGAIAGIVDAARDEPAKEVTDAS
jgi:hypothetical protein